MFGLTAPSHLLARHYDALSNRSILFAGDLQDDYCRYFSGTCTYAYTVDYHQQRRLAKHIGQQRARFTLLPEVSITSDCNTVVYYWPKTKGEAQLQLFSLLNLLPAVADLWLVGENRCGIRSVENLLTPWGVLKKIDSARRCSLYRFSIKTRPPFDLASYWRTYRYQTLTIKTLPGVFSSDALDSGSQLLLDHLPLLQGEVLDLGCGSGILGAGARQRHPSIQLTLSDVNALALAATRATLAINGFDCQVVASDLFSDLPRPFDVILSNPPFHNGRRVSYQATEGLIRSAVTHLRSGGKLLLVANAFLPYAALLDQAFGQHQLVAQTKQFKLYQACK